MSFVILSIEDFSWILYLIVVFIWQLIFCQKKTNFSCGLCVCLCDAADDWWYRSRVFCKFLGDMHLCVGCCIPLCGSRPQVWGALTEPSSLMMANKTWEWMVFCPWQARRRRKPKESSSSFSTKVCKPEKKLITFEVFCYYWPVISFWAVWHFLMQPVSSKTISKGILQMCCEHLSLFVLHFWTRRSYGVKSHCPTSIYLSRSYVFFYVSFIEYFFLLLVYIRFLSIFMPALCSGFTIPSAVHFYSVWTWLLCKTCSLTDRVWIGC